jgi:hypothetical protein
MRMHKILLTEFLFMSWLSISVEHSLNAAPLIIDHNAVAHYSSIPQCWIDTVKKMWVTVPGESHSSGYRIGLELLETAESKFQVNIGGSGEPEGPTDQYLRFSGVTRGDVTDTNSWHYGYGEEDWYTSQTARDNTKIGITYCNTTGHILNAMGFGWCWDMTWLNDVGGTEDPVYRVRWAGSSVGGADGNLRWGLDAGDSTLTGNRVCMDTYLHATQEYINHCTTNGYSTKIFFTTGPIDGSSGEFAYQRYLKHDYIRRYVNNSSNGILFDYADILSWSNAGEQNTQNWTDYGGTPHTFQFIHSDNMLDLDGTYTEDGDHIGKRGALRLGKAMWCMLARMAGWDGTPSVQVKSASASLNPETAKLIQNYPNPFNPSTVISYQLSAVSHVSLKVYDVLGQEIATLVNERKPSGYYEVKWNAMQQSSGVYFYQLSVTDGSKTFQDIKKMVLLK